MAAYSNLNHDHDHDHDDDHDHDYDHDHDDDHDDDDDDDDEDHRSSLPKNSSSPDLPQSSPTTPPRPSSSSSIHPPSRSYTPVPSSVRSTIELCLSQLESPVQVILVVYDLLPPGNLSNLAWLFGVGLYHTAVKIPAIGREIAFGGHPHQHLSGIFSLPIRDDGLPTLAGLRSICEIDMGIIKPVQVFDPDLSSFRSSLLSRYSQTHPLDHQLGTLPYRDLDHHHHHQERENDDDDDEYLVGHLDREEAHLQDHLALDRRQTKPSIRLPPSVAKFNTPIKFQSNLPSSSSQHHSTHQDHSYPPTPTSSFPPPPPITPLSPIEPSPNSYASSSSSSFTSSDSNRSLSSPFTSSNPPPSPTQLETLAFILDRLDRSPDWNGPSYDLLHRNCNTFSDEFCMLLTGKNAPKWINRAASLGSALPCLVPTEWIEPPPALIGSAEPELDSDSQDDTHDGRLDHPTHRSSLASSYQSPRTPMQVPSSIH